MMDLSGCEDKYYEMNPNSDDMLPDGTYLRDNMIVLIEAFSQRNYIKVVPGPGYDKEPTPSQIFLARITNRWGSVSNLKVVGDQITFVATYEDGTKAKRKHSIHFAWLVKTHSIQDGDEALQSPNAELVRDYYAQKMPQTVYIPPSTANRVAIRQFTPGDKAINNLINYNRREMGLMELSDEEIAKRSLIQFGIGDPDPLFQP